jgi:hypothetical protein
MELIAISAAQHWIRMSRQRDSRIGDLPTPLQYRMALNLTSSPSLFSIWRYLRYVFGRHRKVHIHQMALLRCRNSSWTWNSHGSSGRLASSYGHVRSVGDSPATGNPLHVGQPRINEQPHFCQVRLQMRTYSAGLYTCASTDRTTSSG